MASMAPQNKYVFHGVLAECTENRFIEITVDKNRQFLYVQEFFLDSSMKITEQKCQTQTVTLPDYFKLERIIGKPICIGCHGDLYIIQYITQSVKYIQFIALDTLSNYIQCFNDTQHFFTKDFASIQPLRCHISLDYSTILLRLPQDIETQKRWTMILKVKTKFPEKPVGLENEVIGTEKFEIRDRKFHLLAFQHDGNILTADLEEYCARCRFTIHNSQTGEAILQKVHKKNARTCSGCEQYISTGNSSDSEDDSPLEFYSILKCSMCFNRKGNILIIYSICVSNLYRIQCKFDFYDAETLEAVSIIEMDIVNSIVNAKSIKKLFFSAIVSPCDSKLQIWAYNCGSTSFTKCTEVKMPLVNLCEVPTLQMKCREVILASMNIADIKAFQKLQTLPASLWKYLKFK
ncbi:hypothetical protein LOTGIDRAFT_155249 [Lottia gigantea]|uniref:SOCS box domain-containing protein n=1 Tax=Lottia gigantea TaxID=225164 RepID=V3ZST0_LOTGI|nr:hypothetical protein LOTGIDRAFT_155249 [Lottia gigantea]ESO83946.1 hypothetical protein LOTGIDRAFT_155249 [Lottia gigantea]